MTVINPDNLKWNSCNKYVGLSRDSKPTGFNARFSAAFTSSGVDILVEVSDNKHYQNYSKSKLYQGDSIQFAIDSTGHGVTSERVEFQAGLKDKSILWKNFAPPLAGDLPDRYTYAPGEVRFGSVVIEKEPGLLRYKIHVSKDDIYPFSYCHNQPVRFALLVNNNDGKGRDGYLEWGSGIGNGKFPADYGTLTVKIPPKQLFKTTDLNRLNKFASRHIISPKENELVIKIISRARDANNAAMVSTPGGQVISGGRYRVSFQARGNIDLRGMAVLSRIKAGKGTRLDFMPKTRLSQQWQKFNLEFTVPLKFNYARISLFCWQQNGWFEIKNFKLNTANTP